MMSKYLPTHFGFVFVLVIFDLVLKGIAMWRAGRRNQPYWFVALFLINSLGILPLIYLVFFKGKKEKK